MKILSAEQVYTLWATEPYLIKIVDFRPFDEQIRERIPGSLPAHQREIPSSESDNRLTIAIANSVAERSAAQKQLRGREYMLLLGIDEWKTKGLPLIGSDQQLVFLQEGGAHCDYASLRPKGLNNRIWLISDRLSQDTLIVGNLPLPALAQDYPLDVPFAHYTVNLSRRSMGISARGASANCSQISSKTDYYCMGFECGQELLIGEGRAKIVEQDGIRFVYIEGMLFAESKIDHRKFLRNFPEIPQESLLLEQDEHGNISIHSIRQLRQMHQKTVR